uniref:Secreted protein n=1 Tax=Plectus sambesii TaxID=2011161 RepID=A0A914WVG9_9BILA
MGSVWPWPWTSRRLDPTHVRCAHPLLLLALLSARAHTPPTFSRLFSRLSAVHRRARDPMYYFGSVVVASSSPRYSLPSGSRSHRETRPNCANNPLPRQRRLPAPLWVGLASLGVYRFFNGDRCVFVDSNYYSPPVVVARCMRALSGRSRDWFGGGRLPVAASIVQLGLSQ